jgi:uncharacterized protein (DUF1697 family)
VTFVALLRAINLAGHNPVAMLALREVVSGLGFTDVRTLLQSGNVIFHAGARNSRKLESLLEKEAKMKLGLATDFFVRSAKDWEALIERNPFPEEARRDPARLVAMFLKDAPRAHSIADLKASIRGRETVSIEGKEAYLVYPDGIGRSRLTNAFIEAKLGTRGTGRNWNTVVKVAALTQDQVR